MIKEISRKYSEDYDMGRTINNSKKNNFTNGIEIGINAYRKRRALFDTKPQEKSCFIDSYVTLQIIRNKVLKPGLAFLSTDSMFRYTTQ